MKVFYHITEAINYSRHLKILRCKEFKWQDSFNFCSWVLLHYTWQDNKMWSQLNIIDNILLSKCWGIKVVLHSVNFRPWRFFCWSLKKDCCDNIEITLEKTSKSKCDINFFEISLPLHRCLLGKFSFIFGGCSWYSFVVMMIFTLFIAINLLQYINLRSSLSGNVLEKMYSLYIRKTPRKTNVLNLNFFR